MTIGATRGASERRSSRSAPRPDARRRRQFRRRRAVVLAVLVVAAALSARWLNDDDRAHPARHAASVTARHAPSSPRVEAIDPQLFSTGACELLPPLGANRHHTVFLDAGHGGVDPGGTGVTQTGQTIYEADETLSVELDAAALLRAQGYTVAVSRTANTTVVRLAPADVSGSELSIQGAHDDVAARDVCANMAHASILIGIYFDTGASPDNAGSVTGYDADRPFSAANLRLAQLVQDDVLGAMNAQGWQIPNEGVLADSGLGSLVTTGPDSGGVASAAASYNHLLLLGPAQAGYFTTPSLMPGAIIEPLFITDPFEGSLAAGSTGQQVIAEGLDHAVNQYFAPPAPTTSTTAQAAPSSTG